MKSDTETHIKMANEDDSVKSSSFAIFILRILLSLKSL